MVHRGPDDHGLKQLAGCCMGHRRLSIIDLSPLGHQPMSNKDGQVWVIFNGELYGFHTLVRELKQDGHTFRSRSDTEVLLHGYQQWGIAGLCRRLTGMFAFALWDQGEETLYLARDRFGEKPLYYVRHCGEVRFASNTRALFTPGGLIPEPDPDALVAYLNLNFYLPQMPALCGVQVVPPASVVTIKQSGEACERYWTLTCAPREPLTPDEWLDRVENALRDAIGKQLIADVPVGCLLSGGVDSSLVASLAVEAKRDLQLFTVRMPDAALDESAKAASIARVIGGQHHILDAQPVSLSDFIDFQRTFSEPLGDASSIATWMIARYAREHVTAVLTGDGGDELFAGYSSVNLQVKAERWRRAFANPLGRAGASLAERVLTPFVAQPIARKALTAGRLLTTPIKAAHTGVSYIPHELGSALWGPRVSEAAARRQYLRSLSDMWDDTDAITPLDHLLQFDIKFVLVGDYLPKVDTATMACSLEARAPFLDYHLAELAFSMPPDMKRLNDQSKGILKALLTRRLGAAATASVGRKQGFVVPIDRWLDHDWQPLVADLADSPLIRDGYLAGEAVRAILTAVVHQPERYSRLRYSLVVLDLWYRNTRKWSVSPTGSTGR